MQAIRKLVLLPFLAFATAHAAADQAAGSDAGATKSAVGAVPVVVPPAPPQLAPLSPDFQAAMSNSQLATYRYTQLTEQAVALKKLCDTGFGPADICPKPGAALAAGPTAGASVELPTVTEITGARTGLTAVLALPDGRHIVVRPGTQLPDGRRVAGISEDDVRIGRTGGDDLILSFAGAEAK